MVSKVFLIALTACIIAGASAADVAHFKPKRGTRLTLFAGGFIASKGGNFEEPGSTSLYE